MAAEYTSTGQLIKEYHFHPQKTWMTDPLFQRTAGGDVYYYHNDHLGTPQQLVDASGNVVWEAQYSAFGKAHITVSAVENHLRFPGQYYDHETGLHQNYFRDYDAELGRYIQSDPIGIRAGLNYYSYVYSNPLYYIDPTGELGLMPGAVIGSLMGIYGAYLQGGKCGASVNDYIAAAFVGAAGGFMGAGIGVAVGAIGGATGAGLGAVANGTAAFMGSFVGQAVVSEQGIGGVNLGAAIGASIGGAYAGAYGVVKGGAAVDMLTGAVGLVGEVIGAQSGLTVNNMAGVKNEPDGSDCEC